MPDTTGVETPAHDEPDWLSAKRGDGRAFARVFDRHVDRIARHAYRLVPTPADVEDVVAVTFMEAWRRRDTVRFVDGSLLPWLLVTATNAARNVSRASRRHRALLDRLPPGPTALWADDALGDDLASTALSSLRLSDQQLITLCDLYGYGSAEAASVLGIAPTAIRSRLSRARARLATATAQDSCRTPIGGETV